MEYAYLDQHPLALWRDPPLSGPHDDSDNDGLTNAQEAALGSNPNSSDTDNDGMSDADEARFELDINVDDAALDADGDGVSNLNELIAGTNPSDHLAKAAAGAIIPTLKILFSD